MHSFTSCLIHYVWSTKNRESSLNPQIRERLWPYLGGIAKQNKMKAFAIGGAGDHVHILISLPSTLSVAKAAQLLKGNSSKWIRETFPKTSLIWMAGRLWRIQHRNFRSRCDDGLHQKSGRASSHTIVSRGICDDAT
jgi:REP element-mobilizing transposase RayT